VIGWSSRWHPDDVACHPKSSLCYNVLYNLRCPVRLSTSILDDDDDDEIILNQGESQSHWRPAAAAANVHRATLQPETRTLTSTGHVIHVSMSNGGQGWKMASKKPRFFRFFKKLKNFQKSRF